MISLNVRGLNDKIKEKVFITFKQTETGYYDTTRDTPSNKPQSDFEEQNIPNQIHSKGLKKARGIAVLLSRTMHFQEIDTLKDKEGRFIVTKGLLNDQKVTFASLYAPNNGQMGF